MSWGQPATAAPVAAPAPVVAVVCEAPECKAQALLKLRFDDGNEASSCVSHAKEAIDAGVASVIGHVEGAPFDEAARDLLLKRWEQAKLTLEAAKNSEMEIRKAVGAYVFPTPKEGVNNHELGGGYVLKMGHKLNYKLSGDNDAIEAVEDKCVALGNEGQFLAERIIVWKADFSKSEYNKLDEALPTHKAVKDLIDGILEITTGSPSLEIKEPKATLRG
jgi:hypothetical protein